ncbi:uncharacterized protein LOC124263504 [Haliotis rubra]|uniref:uncharacterized protein LOC124263504 n=1 Tax=Haliotis rubra TaxID=36100 RepID=UPI001EE5B7C5|nr:uncharacterized protein LOC124263504 [Haliotis rubra]XP_046554119.1 uncharacterized protein LOC124263504 [Haliotis rubra]XP_046554121.1 uncharacterized protein LOC124263504 [Haliotis rubra]XP_046554122.1 uncharacterized protein LOC124263504 [Haliotis rubra]
MWTVVLAVMVALLPCVTPQYRSSDTRVWHVNQYPDPWWFPEQCNRDNKSAVCDPNGIVTKQQANDIDRLIEAVAVDTRCPCYDCVSNQRGYVIRVALMHQMENLLEEGEEIMDRLKNARLFAYLLTKRWKLTGNCNETVLIVYSKADNVLYTMTGTSAGRALKDNLIVEITVDVRPFFDDEDTITEGIKEMIRRYRAVFKKTYSRAEAGTGSFPRDRDNAAELVKLSPVLCLFTMTMLIFS